MRRYHKNDKGFTMAEMLITVAIIVILCGFGFVAVIAHQRNLKRMEMDETAQEIFIAAQNHLTAAEANGQWDAFLKKTSGTTSGAARGVELANGPTGYDKTSDKDAASRKFYSFTTESDEAVQKGAVSLILPEGSIDETLRGHHFYVEYDAMSGTVYGVFYTDADHDITAEDAQEVSRTDPDARRDYKDANGKRTIIGYYGGALGELKNSGDLYAPAVAVRNAESLVLYVVDKNYYRHVSAQNGAKTFQTQLKLTFEGETSKATMEKTVDPDTLGDGDPFSKSVLACKSAKQFSIVVPGNSAEEGGTQRTESVNAEYYAIVLDSIVREDGHFADLFSGATSGENGGNTQFIPGEDIKITVTLHSDNGGEDVSQTVRVNSLFNSVKTEKNFLGLGASKTIVTVSNPRHLENLSTEVSGVDFTQIKSGATIDTVSVVRNLFWDEDAAAEKAAKEQNEKETVTAFLPAIASATGMESPFGYCAEGKSAENTKEKENIRIYPYAAGTSAGNASEGSENHSGSTNVTGMEDGSSGNAVAEISKGACYGITNTEIQNLEGNNHILAAFRFEGEQKAALINEAADGLQISDLVIADATAAVTGRAASGSETDSGKTPTAAILIADAKSGSIDHIAVRWYEGSAADGTANPQVDLSQDKDHEIADGLQGCRIFSSEGIASALIGSIDAGAESASGTFTIQHTTVATVAPSTSGKKTASLGVEGETAAILIGQVKSGAVSIDNSSETNETKRSTVAVEGTLSVDADCGTKEKQTAGGLIGSVDAGKVELQQFVFSADSMEISGGAAAGGVIGQIQSGTKQAVSLKELNLAARSMKATASEQYAGGLIGADSGKNGTAVENVNLSLNTLEVNGKLAAGGAVGQVSAGSLSLKETNILTSKATGDSGEIGQEETEEEDQYGIRVTADNGTAGGLIGSATNQVTELTIQETAVSGAGTADQIEAGSSAGGLIGDTKASTTTIRSSMASLYIRSEGNGGNSGGFSSTDGAGGLIGSASGNVTVTDSYSGGRTTNADNPEKKAGDAPAMQARYVDRAEGQGRYNVQLESGSGAAGGLIGRYTGGSLKLTNSYSTSSVAVNKASGAKAGGLIGEADNLTANQTYCTGRVYAVSGTGTSSATKEESTPDYGTYAGKLGGISGQNNYYLKGMKGAPAGSVGTLNGNSQNPTIGEQILTGADYYDNNCPLKQGVNPAQKSYYFDGTITEKYAFKTFTTAYAKPLYDPNTGKKIEEADAENSKYAQIGDWEIPAEESTEGTYGLIYYEKIYDPTTQQSEPTLYFHGYMFKSGTDAANATYQEIHQTMLSEKHTYTSEGFVKDKNTYVSESGYLLLIKGKADENLKLWFGDRTKSIDEARNCGDTVSSFPIYDLGENSKFAGYTAYNLTLSVSKIQNFCWWFWPEKNRANQFGALMVLRQNNKSVAAFTYAPFFADALKPVEEGRVQTVSKAKDNSADQPQAIIRSADQLLYFMDFENNATGGWNSQDGYLKREKGLSQYIIEQQLDITFDSSKNSFTYNGQSNPESTSFNYIGSSGVFRSTLRPGDLDNDFYVLDGLRHPLIDNIAGKTCNLQITNIKAPYFIQSISGKDAKVQTITITDACFAKGQNYDQRTSAGFVESLSDGQIEDCHIRNASIYGNGFVNTSTNAAKITNCTIVNATIWNNGFIQSNGGSIENCGIYADPSLYSNNQVSNYRPFESSDGTYDYVSIGIAPGGTRSSESVAGFVQEQSGWGQKINNCYVAGTVYGDNDVSGFVGNAQFNLTVENCYANVVIDADGDVGGFASETNNDDTVLRNCHALGVIKNAKKASGFVRKINNGAVTGCYEAFWNVKAEKWYPFYETKSSGKTSQNNFYLTDYAVSVTEGELVDYSNQAKGLTYQELCNLKIDGLKEQADSTAGYYRYMERDSDHVSYPYPMPEGQTAYGDWSHEDPGCYSLLYYEKVNETYYFHGYTTSDGLEYQEVKSSGAGTENGLLAQKDTEAKEDGYVLISGTNSAWSTFGRADNSGAVSSPVNHADTNIFTAVSADSGLQSALKALTGLKKKDTDKVYVFQLDQYLGYEDAANQFASWQTLTQESGGVGIAVYSTRGMTPMAKFSFQPFFADTVKTPEVTSGGTSGDKKIAFVATKDGSPEHDYRVRTLRQLKALSDWDGQRLTGVADGGTLKSQFDEDDTKRYSYLSTANENYNTHLKICQDLDINAKDTEVNFDRLDGTYVGRTYNGQAVSLQNIAYDFADVVAPGGAIDSLVIDQANLQGKASTQAQNGEIAHGGQREFVEYNYGTISNITVQNSELGSAGLVYQNGDVPENVLKEIIDSPKQGSPRKDMEPYFQDKGRACQYTTQITYERSSDIHVGTITNCNVINSQVNGTGFIWNNKGGNIKNSKVEGCELGSGAGFVKTNQAIFVQAPKWKKTYEYWYNRWNWTDQTEAVSEDRITKYGWPVEESSSEKISVAVDAVIENCQVVDCKVKGNGFAGENTVNTDGSVGTSSNNSSGAKATISNCQVYGTSDYTDMQIGSASGTSGVKEAAGFVGSNGKGAEVANCSVTGQVSAQKSAAGFVLTNDGAITGSYANTKITCKGQQGAMISGFVLTNTGTIERSHSLGEETYQQSGTGNNGAAGFVVNNQTADGSGSDAVIRNCYAAIWQLTNLQGISYVPFGSKGSGADAGTYQNCYAMKMSSENGYSGTYSASTAPTGVTYVSGDALKEQCGFDLGDAAADGKTVAYQAELKSERYPFPCGSGITNYGDWKLTDGVSEEAHTITLNAGNKAVFTEDLVRALSMDTAVQAASVNDASTDGTSSQGGVLQDTIPEEERREVQVELGEEETELDLTAFTPVRKGWKLLGWLITSPSNLSASEKKTTVSDIVTKINKISDGDVDGNADAANTDDVTGTGDSENASEGSGQSRTKTSGSSKAVYELETGTKSYHYAPDAVITVTEDMTLAAVWVPDEDTIAKVKDGTLRMDENGNILDEDADADSADTAGTGSSDQDDTALTEDTAQTAGTAQTGDAAGTEDSATDGTTETDQADQGNSDSSDAGETQDSAGTEQTADNAGTDAAESGETGQSDASGNAGSSEASTEAATYSTEDAEPVKDQEI